MVIRLLKENLETMHAGLAALRPLCVEDAEEYAEAKYNPDGDGLGAFTPGEVRAAVADAVRDRDRYDFLVVDPAGAILGEAVLEAIDWGAEAGRLRILLFREEVLGTGVGKAAMDLLLEFAFDRLCLHRVESEILDSDLRSRRACESSGFLREGVRREAVSVDGGFLDTALYSLLEQEYHGRC